MIRRCLFVIFLLGVGNLSAAPWSVDLAVAGGTQRETIRIECFMDSPAQRGFLPLRVFLRNIGEDAGEWRFRFTARDGYDDSNHMRSEFRLRVEGGAEQTVEWLVPVFPSSTGDSYHKSIGVAVNGPDGFAVNHESILTDSGGYGSGPQALAGLSESISLLHRESLQAELQNRRRSGASIKLARVDLRMLPESPLGLMGLDILVMTQAEYAGLSQANRYALRQWLAQGGRLVYADENLPEDFVGQGGIHGIPFDKWNMPAILDALQRIPTLNDRLAADPQQFASFRWHLRQDIPEISRPIGLLMVFVLLIALLLGPVNLFLAHRKKMPARVLWTTPILSAGLSLILIAVIILSDGFGGSGNRSLAMLLLPGDQIEVMVQEQISRTGVLLADAFTLPGGVVMSNIDTDFDGSGTGRRRRRNNETSGRFELAPSGATRGDWFKSRRIQGHVLISSRPSRARIQFLPGPVPEVLSSVDAPLRDLVVRDDNGAYWTTDTLLAGERKPLAPLSAAAAEALLKQLVTREQGPVSAHMANGGRKGWFFAKGAEGKGPFVDTLPSVRWKAQPVCWLGPLSPGGRP